MTPRFIGLVVAAPVILVAAAGIASGQPQVNGRKPVAGSLQTTTRPSKVWVYFKDKGLNSPAERDAAIAKLAATYDSHAIERRRARRTLPGLFDESDIPVAARYRQAVTGLGAKIHIESSWLNAVSAYATPEQARAIATLPFVRSVEPVRGGRRLTPPGAEETPRPVPTPVGDDFYGLSSEQLNQINLTAVHGLGFTGSGVRIGILDTGFKRTHAAFNYPGHTLQVITEWDFVKNDNNTGPEPSDDPGQHVHGTLILGCLGAYLPNELVGGAYDAKFILCKTEDITSETPIEEDNYVGGLQLIEANGGDVATASLVYMDWYTYSQLNGSTCVTTIAVNMATANGVYCCNAGGNSGHDANPATGNLGGAPADAFKVLTIGAADGGGDIAGFSSDGPTADGRLKPELLARGVDTKTVDPGNDTGYAGASGTSLSTPVAACAVACLAQARPWWSVDRMRASLFNKASDFVAFGQPDPLFVRGYGMINAAATLAADCYANCDSSTTAPTLNVNDFTCFLNQFAAGSPYANCDSSTNAPELNVNDFNCFVNRFAAGCP